MQFDSLLNHDTYYRNLQPFVGPDLFAAGFVSCWSQLNDASHRQLVQSLEMAFSSPNIPPKVIATFLNLVCLSFDLPCHRKEYIKSC